MKKQLFGAKTQPFTNIPFFCTNVNAGRQQSACQPKLWSDWYAEGLVKFGSEASELAARTTVDAVPVGQKLLTTGGTDGHQNRL